MDKKIVTAAELAEQLSLKAKTIRDWARQGKIPALRMSPKVIRFDPDEVIRALKPGPTKSTVLGASHER